MPDFGQIFGTVLIWIQIIVGLGLLIFIHELGHFLVAKWKGVRVEAFSLGMGPILWKRVWNGTEYRISAIPLGGYVKMAGENVGDPKTGAPDELTSKSAFARLQIFAAGALMNLAIAFPIAILACLAGRTEGAPVIGDPSNADMRGGLKPGDKLIEADGRKIASIEEYRKIMVGQSQGTKVPVLVERNGERVTASVEVMESKNHGTVPPALTLHRIEPDSQVYKDGLRKGMEILTVNGEPAGTASKEFTDQLNAAALAGPVRLQVVDPEGTDKEIVLSRIPVQTEVWIEADPRAIEPVIAQPVPGSAAALAGLQAGDTITKVNDREIANFKELMDAVHEFRGTRVTIEYKRVDKNLKGETVIRFRGRNSGVLGVEPGRTSRIATVAEGSALHQAGLRSGDELVDSMTSDFAWQGRRGPVTLKIKRDSQVITLAGKERQRPKLAEAGFGVTNGIVEMEYNRIQRTWTFKEAVVSGLHEPVEIIDLTFRILGKLFVRQEDPSGLAGPLGIFKASYAHAETGLGNFLWLLVLITVNLGIFNLLPVPVLDGGHILLLAIEKIKGSPPSPRFVERFQLVGLLLLLSLLIFVTVNDARNLW